MTRLAKATVIIWINIELFEEEILRLEIEMIEKGHMLEIDKLGYNDNNELIVLYGTIDTIEGTITIPS